MAVKRPEWLDNAGEDVPDVEVEERNLDLVIRMIESFGIPFRGKVYSVGPVSVPDGFRLARIVKRWDSLVDGLNQEYRPEAAAEAEKCFREGARIMNRIFVRRGLRLLPKFLRPNPFMRASNAEWRELLGFALVCRMRSSIRPRSSTRRAASSSRIWQTHSSSSPESFQPGATSEVLH